MKIELTRREFLKGSALGGAGLAALGSPSAFSHAPTSNDGAGQKLPLPFQENFRTLAAQWIERRSPSSSLLVKGGGLQFKSPAHGLAHVQRPAGDNLITLSVELSRWGSIYLVWGSGEWCGVGQISPTPFGRIYSAVVLNGREKKGLHRGVNFGVPRWLRIRLGENYVRFAYSENGEEWAALRTIERPKAYAGAPKLIAVGRNYAAGDRPFFGSAGAVKRSANSAVEVSGRILALRVEATPQAELTLSGAELAALSRPKVDPVMAVLDGSDRDPSFEGIVNCHPPMKYPREVVGVPAHPLDIGVDYLGRMDVSPWTAPTAWFEIGSPPAPLGKEGVPFKRRLMRGYIPILTLTTIRAGVTYELTIFGWSEGFSVTKPLFAYARLTARPTGGDAPREVLLASPAGVRRTWRFDPNRSICIKLEYPKPETAAEVTPAEFEARLAATAALWERTLAPAARFDVPDTRVMEAYRAWFAYSMLNWDTIDGYIEPHDGAGFYEQMFGVSVSLHTMALDQYGLHDDATKILGTQIHFQRPDGLYTQNCGLPDPGAFLAGLAAHYRMTADRNWLEDVTPHIASQMAWLLRQRKAAPRSGTLRGLVKFRPYNDYPSPAFDYLGDAWCAVGMRNSAETMKTLGRREAALYAAEADRYRSDILDSMSSAAFKDQGQMLLPLEPETRRLLKLDDYQAGGYYGLTAGQLLETDFLAPTERHAKWILDAIENRGGLVAELAEFECGIDHAYTYGYLHDQLKLGSIRKTLLGFWSMLAFGMTRETYSPVEVTMIETGENNFTLPHLYSCTEQLRLLRSLLLREDRGILHIGEGIPRAWLEPGKHVTATAAPTQFGALSYRIEAESDGVMSAAITPPQRAAPTEIRLRLRQPLHKTISSVRSTPAANTSWSGETVVLHEVKSPLNLRILFG